MSQLRYGPDNRVRTPAACAIENSANFALARDLLRRKGGSEEGDRKRALR
jgi:hypothetical protein